MYVFLDKINRLTVAYCELIDQQRGGKCVKIFTVIYFPEFVTLDNNDSFSFFQQYNIKRKGSRLFFINRNTSNDTQIIIKFPAAHVSNMFSPFIEHQLFVCQTTSCLLFLTFSSQQYLYIVLMLHFCNSYYEKYYINFYYHQNNE